MVRGLESSLLVFAVATLMLLAGCPHAKQADSDGEKKDAAPSRASVALRVLVVNEPAVADAINRLRGEWAERSGGELSATSTTWADVSKAKSLEADVVVFSSRYLGDLCARDWLEPVRQNVLKSEEFNAADVFPVIRFELMRWGGEVMALPLGVDTGFATPTPAIAFLGNLAARADTAGNAELLFDPETMKARIAERESVETLEYSRSINEWDVTKQKLPSNPEPKMTGRGRAAVIGLSDRMIAVTSASRNAASAFKLLSWLASAEVSSQLVQAGDRQMPVRKSLATALSWNKDEKSAKQHSFDAQMLESRLGQSEHPIQHFVVPRIPGVDEYMAALNKAVTSAFETGGVAPRESLEKAAKQWEQITDAHGRDAQRRAYLKHLGIPEN